MPSPGRLPFLLTAVIAATAGAVTACGQDPAPDAEVAPAAVADARSRVDQIQLALDRWTDASDLAGARAAAEEVSNLITGPGVSLYGDRDGDGVVGGAVAVGLLPGEAGEASLGQRIEVCAGPDLLGGSWRDPGSRWRDLAGRIAQWTPTNNTFPQLASHAQRTVGWAQLTLAAQDLSEAHEFSGHAQLHVDAVAAAVGECA